MADDKAFVLTFILLISKISPGSTSCAGTCIQSHKSHLETGTKNWALTGHTFKTFLVSKVFDCHVGCYQERCRCRAFQILGSQCELLDENRFTAPQDFMQKTGFSYFSMSLEYVTKSPTSGCQKASCSNGCCASNPCLNGATCSEQCDDTGATFNCTCVQGFVGKRCQNLAGSTCKGHKKYLASVGHEINSGVFPLPGPQNTFYSVFCDFGSEEGFSWTVIESFTKANKSVFRDKPFYRSFEVSQDVFRWDIDRLALSRMKQIAENSTHFRATCRYDSEGPNYTDYLRAKLTEADILSLNFKGCRNYEYINVRGYSCHNCTAQFVQKDSWHAHFDSYWGTSVYGCEFTSANAGSVPKPGGEDDFGFYETVNPVHRCMSTESSTTQWWLGGK